MDPYTSKRLKQPQAKTSANIDRRFFIPKLSVYERFYMQYFTQSMINRTINQRGK